MSTRVRGHVLDVENLVENLVAYMTILGHNVQDVEIERDGDDYLFHPLDQDYKRIVLDPLFIPDLESTKNLKLITNDPLFEYLDLHFDEDIEVVQKWGVHFSDAFNDSEEKISFYEELNQIVLECNSLRRKGFNTITTNLDPVFDDERVGDDDLFDIIGSFSDLWNFESIRESIDETPLNFLILKIMDKRIQTPFLPLYSGQIPTLELLEEGKIIQRNTPDCDKLFNAWFRDRVTDLMFGRLFTVKLDGIWNRANITNMVFLDAIGKYAYNNLFNINIKYRNIKLNRDFTFDADLLSIDEYNRLKYRIEELWNMYGRYSFHIEKPYLTLKQNLSSYLGSDVLITSFDQNHWIVPLVDELSSEQSIDLHQMIESTKSGKFARTWEERGFIDGPSQPKFDGEIDGNTIRTRSGQKIVIEKKKWVESLSPFAIEYYGVKGKYPINPRLLFI